VWNIKKIFLLIIMATSGLVVAQKKENDFLKERVFDALEEVESQENEEIDYVEDEY